MKDFRQQELELYNHRLTLALSLGAVLILLFAMLDYVIARPRFASFLVLRLLCAGVFAAILLFRRTRTYSQHPFAITLLATSAAAITIGAMIFQLGGMTSSYHIGMILIMIACTAILPLNSRQTIFIAALVYLVYALAVLIPFAAPKENFALFFTNSFFFFFFSVIAVVQNAQDYESRQREYILRQDLDTKARELNRYATNLEEVVRQRVKDLKESELRYQELYDNIIDMVVLIGEQGQILAANPSFTEIAGEERHKSFLDIVHKNDRDEVSRYFIYPHCEDVEGMQFRMMNDRGQVVDVECSARCLRRNEQFVGFQLVLRDITARKQLERELLLSLQQTVEARQATILGLAKLTEYRDRDTGGHLERIREYSQLLARELMNRPHYCDYITEDYIDDVFQSSVLHDIGKVGIPDAILLKPGKLSPEEFSLIKLHSVYGGDMLKSIEEKSGSGSTFLAMGKIIAYHHHEKWDGTGYPAGLAGRDIPLSPRLVALADVYDALTSDRSYKKAYSHQEAVRIISEEKGRHFDPEVVDAFLANEDLFCKIRNRLSG